MEINFDTLQPVFDSNRYYIVLSSLGLLFIKLKGNDKDSPIEVEYENGLQVNNLSPSFFLRTYELREVNETLFPNVNLPFPRKVLITEYSILHPLAHYLTRGDLSFHERLEILLQITSIVWYGYKKIGLVHNDLNSGNILLEKRDTICDLQIGEITLHTRFVCRLYDYGRSYFSKEMKDTDKHIPIVNDLKQICYSLLRHSNISISRKYIGIVYSWNGMGGIHSLLDTLAREIQCEIRTEKIIKIHPERFTSYQPSLTKISPQPILF